VAGRQRKIIQPIEIGAVRAIHVRNGQFVHEGPAAARARPDAGQRRRAQMRASAAFRAGDPGAQRLRCSRIWPARPAMFVAPPDTPNNVLRTEQAFRPHRSRAV
jgi:hemolysin D